MDLAYRLARPFLFAQSAESAHDFTLTWARRVSRLPGALAGIRAAYHPGRVSGLEVSAFGLDFEHPLGLAAGLDKDGEVIDLWAALGFAFVEVGTVTPGRGQPGNPLPRLERLPKDRALVNRMGFNNRGADALGRRLSHRRTTVPVGANLGKAKLTAPEHAADDYEAALIPVWASSDYVVVNVSSPNTPGLRDLQAVDALTPILDRVERINRTLADASPHPRRPVLLKISPDLADEDIDRIADLARERRLDGLIATNTTIHLDWAKTPASIAGGLSGAPLQRRAEEVTRRLYRRVGPALPIVGVGGVENAQVAYQRIRAGARLLQLYSALVYQGPGVIREIVLGLRRLLTRDGFRSVDEVVGLDT